MPGVDFALANQPSYLDNYIEAPDLPWLQNVRVGHYFEPFSLERVTQNRNNTFMERSLVDTFAPARNMGVMAYGNTENERATWQIGTFRTNSDNIGNDSFDSGQALTMRGTVLPWWDEPSDGEFFLHLGAAYSYRATSQNQVRFRNTPELRKQQPANVFGPVGPPSPSNYINGQPGPFAPIFVDTGFIPARNFQLFDPEFALIVSESLYANEVQLHPCVSGGQAGRQQHDRSVRHALRLRVLVLPPACRRIRLPPKPRLQCALSWQ